MLTLLKKQKKTQNNNKTEGIHVLAPHSDTTARPCGVGHFSKIASLPLPG